MYLTVREFAFIFGVTAQTVYNQREKGLIKFTVKTYDLDSPILRGHGHYMIHESEVKRLLGVWGKA